MTAKTPTERQRDYLERLKKEGLKELRLWAHPDDHPRIKDHAAKLARKRAKEKA